MLSLTLSVVFATWTCADEDARIRAHLEDAYVQLQQAAPPGLTLKQTEARATVLARLRAYIDAGRFPRNRSARDATPVFVDERGTHCAMGQLLSELGADEVVENIRATRNLETVPVLSDEPGLAAWLEAHGLTAEEAALVQPTYFTCGVDAPCFRRASPVYDVRMLRPTDGGPELTLVPLRTLTDAGACLDELTEPYSFYSRSLAPDGIVFALPQGLFADRDGWIRPLDARCAERPRMTDEDRLEPDVKQCIKNLARRDLRWLAAACNDSSWSESQSLLCHADGRYRSTHLPPLGTMRFLLEDWLAANGLDLADAGIDPAAYEEMERLLWERSDDGGMPLSASVLPLLSWDGGIAPPDVACPRDGGPTLLDAGVLDAGTDPTPAPVGCGCTSTTGLMAWALAFLLGARRGRR